VEFDIESLRPTYKLIMGVPGGSNAFEIALRLGLPEEIVIKARSLIDKDKLEVENIIQKLNKERKHFQELREKAELKENKVEKIKKEYEELLDQLKKEEKEIVREAKKEAKDIIKNAEKKSKKIIRKLKEQADQTRPELDREATEINKKMKRIKNELKVEDKELPQAKSGQIKKGMMVRIRNLGKKGRVVDIEGDKAIIQAGVMKVNADLSDLIPIEMPDVQQERLVKKYQVKKNQSTVNSLDLRGLRYDEAQMKLDKYLDDARLAGYKTVEIIHGKGTGALRDAVQEILEKNNWVNNYRYGNQSEGGMGVTIVKIK